MLCKIFGIEQGKRVAVRIDHLDLSLVKIGKTVIIHQTHIIGFQVKGLGRHQGVVSGPFQNSLVVESHGLLREIYRLSRHLPHPSSFQFGDGPGHASGKPAHRIKRVSADHAVEFADLLSHLNRFFAKGFSHRINDTENVPLMVRGAGPHEKIGAAEKIEMQQVVFIDKREMHQLAELYGGRRRLDIENTVQGLAACDVMGGGTDTAYFLGQRRHLLNGPAFTEFFKSLEIGHLEKGVGRFTGIIKIDADLSVALQAGNRIDDDFFTHLFHPKVCRQKSIRQGCNGRTAPPHQVWTRWPPSFPVHHRIL